MGLWGIGCEALGPLEQLSSDFNLGLCFDLY